MQYMGGKARIAKRLTELMLSNTCDRNVYLEPFIGGAYVLAKMAPHFSTPVGGDSFPGLVGYWSAIRDGWEPPAEITSEDYHKLRNADISPLKVFAGFGCSFGGKWFGGYGRQNVDAKHPTGHVSHGSRKTSLAKREGLQGVFMAEIGYDNWIPVPETVVYCDPPYAGTTTYAGTEPFDSARFWSIMDQWSDSGCHVFVSEYAAPNHWKILEEIDTPSSLKSGDNSTRVVERLFTR